MTVSDLIVILQGKPPDAEVVCGEFIPLYQANQKVDVRDIIETEIEVEEE